jgi:2,4-dienoyl-CoA reductase-like NADH-dependent reductase (Old Yellow Enzyme family)/thioredoxin reductase
MTGTLRHVFEPIQIRGVEIPNRVVRTAHLTKLGMGLVSDDLIEYHAARARGGVGLSIIEATAVHPSSVLGLIGYDDSVIPTYKKLMDTIRPLGMRVFQQLWHGGHVYPPPGGLPMRGASALPGPVAGMPAVPIGTDEIGDFVAAYAAAARRSAKGGIDGLEVAASHGYLMHQFLSPLTNNREDRYGGSLENRMRFLVEVLTAVREAAGPDMPVGVRVGAGQIAGDLDEQTVAEVARRLAGLGLIDFLNASMGDYYAMHQMMGGMDRPAGYMLPSSGQVTGSVTGIPRIVTGRFRTLEEVEQVLRTGECDLVSMVRAHIADPDIVRKTRAGRAAEVRPCIGCNQGCVARTSGVDLRLGCTVNPAVGREKEYGDDVIGTTAHPRRVVVIGGGPAGLEAARVARLRGHEVALYDGSDRLGGALNVARRAPQTQGLDDIADWYRTEMKRLGVEYHLSTPMDADDIVALNPHVVIVATGADPTMDGRLIAAPGEVVDGIDAPNVVSSVELLTQEPPAAGSHALVVDDVGQYEAVSVAEYLVQHGVHVTVATRLPMFGPLVDAAMRMTPALERLNSAPGEFTTLTRVTLASVRPGKASVRSLAGAADTAIAADLVVLVTYKASRNRLASDLAGRVPDIRLVGDALAARDLQVAIREGNDAGRWIA